MSEYMLRPHTNPEVLTSPTDYEALLIESVEHDDSMRGFVLGLSVFIDLLPAETVGRDARNKLCAMTTRYIVDYADRNGLEVEEMISVRKAVLDLVFPIERVICSGVIDIPGPRTPDWAERAAGDYTTVQNDALA